MNKQINPDHCYPCDGVMYTLKHVPDTPLWWVMKDGRKWRDFTSLYAAKCWLEHMLEGGQDDHVRR